MCDLVICKLSDASASVGGGKEMILLCEKVAKGKLLVFEHVRQQYFLINMLFLNMSCLFLLL